MGRKPHLCPGLHRQLWKSSWFTIVRFQSTGSDHGYECAEICSKSMIRSMIINNGKSVKTFTLGVALRRGRRCLNHRQACPSALWSGLSVACPKLSELVLCWTACPSVTRALWRIDVYRDIDGLNFYVKSSFIFTFRDIEHLRALQRLFSVRYSLWRH